MEMNTQQNAIFDSLKCFNKVDQKFGSYRLMMAVESKIYTEK